MQERRLLKIKISRARTNLLFFIILSALQIYTIATGGSLLMPFSSSLALWIANDSLFFAIQNNDPSILTLGVVGAAAVIVVFFLCYMLSKKHKKWMLAGLILIGIDTLVLLFLAFVNGLSGWVLDIVLHGMLFYFMFVGVKASIDLEKLPPYDSVDEPIWSNRQPSFGDEPQQGGEMFDAGFVPRDDEEELSDPIGKYEDDGTLPLCNGKKNGLAVFAVIRNNVAELVINGMVCDRLSVANKTEFTLCAIVNEINFSFEYTKTPDRDAMFLYADEELIDSAIIE